MWNRSYFRENFQYKFSVGTDVNYEGRRESSTSQILPSWILPQRVDLFRLSPVAMPVGGTDPYLSFILTSALSHCRFGNLRLQRHLDIQNRTT